MLTQISSLKSLTPGVIGLTYCILNVLKFVLKRQNSQNSSFFNFIKTFLHSTAIGIRCKDGVVFGVEKLVTSKLYEAGTGKRIFTIDRHVGMVFNIFIQILFLL